MDIIGWGNWTVDGLDGSGAENVIMKEISSSHDQVREKKQSTNKRLIKSGVQKSCSNVNPNEDLAFDWHVARTICFSLSDSLLATP